MFPLFIRIMTVCGLCLVFYPLQAEMPKLITDDRAFVEDIKAEKTNGIVSGAHNILFKSLRNIETLQYMPIKRALLAIDDSAQAACLLHHISTQNRQEDYLFTNPLYFLLNQRLYQQIEDTPLSADLLTKNGKITNLSKIFTRETKSILLYLPLRSYGDVIDDMIAKVPKQNLLPITGVNMHGSTSKMFFSKRAEFSIMYPGEVFEFEQHNRAPSYRSYLFAGTEEALFGRIMCNKHPSSIQFIDKVNKILPELVSTDAMAELHYRYNSEQDTAMVARSLNLLKSLVEDKQ